MASRGDALTRRPVDLLLTDVMMPGMSGFVLARQAKHLRPDLKIIDMSGDGETAEGRDGERHGPLLQSRFASLSF